MFGIICAALVWATYVSSVLAQEPIVWSSPEQLSDPEQYAGAPAIAADSAGNVHTMWRQRVSGADALYYRRWDGHDWTKAVDVLADANDAMEFPELAITSDGIIHAVWTTGQRGEVRYAQAPACCADNPHNWSQPISLGGPVMLTAALVADKQGRLHVAFAPSDGPTIVYRRSDDGGITWPIWVEIPGGANLSEEYTIHPRLAVDAHNRVYAVWTVEPWPGRYAMFARSDDAGETWSTPQVIDRFDSGDYRSDSYGPEYIDVEARADDEVHLIWDGPPTVERNHIWSADGGQTWSQAITLIPELTGVGRSGFNDMAFDSAGTLHATALGRPYHAQWNGGAWSPTTGLRSAEDGKAEWMRTVVNLGNQLFVIWVDVPGPDVQSTIWYVQGDIRGAPSIAPEALPSMAEYSASLAVVPTVTPTITATVMAVSPVAPRALGNETGQIDVRHSSPSPTSAVIWSVLPSAALVAIVFVVRMRRKRFRWRNDT